MPPALPTRVLGKRLRLRRVAGWVRRGEDAPETGFALDTPSGRLPVRIPGAAFREGRRLALVAAYRGRGRRRDWALWVDPVSGHHGWIARPWLLASRLGLPWRPFTWADPAAVAFLVWAVAVRSLRFPAAYRAVEGLFGEAATRAAVDGLFGVFRRIDRLLVEWEWMKAYDRVFDFPVWLGVGVGMAYAGVRLLLSGLSLGYATLRLRRSALRVAGAVR